MKPFNESEKKLIHELLSHMYNTSCDCRREWGLKPNLHPGRHDDLCPYRLKVENTNIRELFYDE